MSDPDAFVHALRRVCLALIDAEPEITRQDLVAGDGDAGLTLRAGAVGVLRALEGGEIKGKDIIDDLAIIGREVDTRMGGTSGALYA